MNEALEGVYENALEAFETSFNEASDEYIRNGGDLEAATIAVTVEIADGDDGLPDGVEATDDVPSGALEQNGDGTYNTYDAGGRKVGTISAEEYEAAGRF